MVDDSEFMYISRKSVNLDSFARTILKHSETERETLEFSIPYYTWVEVTVLLRL
jgi:hypothetical protein